MPDRPAASAPARNCAGGDASANRPAGSPPRRAAPPDRARASAAYTRSEPRGSVGSVSTAAPPAARTASAITASPQATATGPMSASRPRSSTCTIIGLPWMSASGLPGSRVEAMRAGMMTIGLHGLMGKGRFPMVRAPYGGARPRATAGRRLLLRVWSGSTGKSRRMDSMEVNKGIAAVLVAGIVVFSHRPDRRQPGAREAPEKPVLNIAAAPGRNRRRRGQAGGTCRRSRRCWPAADPTAGEAFANKVCVACHTFDKGGKPGVGPNLYGVVGAPHDHRAGLQLFAGAEVQAGALDLRRVERVAAQAERLCARHAHGVRRHHQRQAAGRRDRLSAHAVGQSAAAAGARGGAADCAATAAAPAAGRTSSRSREAATLGIRLAVEPAELDRSRSPPPKPRRMSPARWCGRSSVPGSPSTRSPTDRR